MKTKNKSFSVLFHSLFLLLLILTSTDNVRASDREYPISVSILSESWAFPGTGITRINPFYPGLMLGVARHKNDKVISFPQSLHLGGFYNSNAGSAIFLYADQSLRIAPRFGLVLDLAIGLGYFHAFHPDPVYRKAENNAYEKSIDSGKASVMLSFSQTIAYDLSKKTNLPMAPFIKTQWIASYPYFDMMMPIRPTNLVHLGTCIYF